MTDFYAILKNAIAESGARDLLARTTLYKRASVMLDKQIESLNPPLSDEACQVQRTALENAVRRIEAEFAGRQAGAGSVGTAPPRARPLQARPPQARPPQAGAGDRSPPSKSPAKGTGGAPSRAQLPGNAAAAAKAPHRRGRGARLVALLALLVIAGGGAVAYWRWDQVEPRLASVTDKAMTRLGMGAADAPAGIAPDNAVKEGATPETASAPSPPPESTAPVILPPEPGPASSEAVGDTPPPPSVPQVQAPPALPPPAAPAPAAPVLVTPEAGSAAAPPANEQPASDPDKDQDRISPVVTPTERAYLIIEDSGPENENQRISGTALWSLDGTGDDTSLAAAVTIPERSGKFHLVIRRNTDAALPASHTIDIIYRGEGDPEGSITDVSGIMVRVENDNSSLPMRGAGALVEPGQFVVGLSNTAADRVQNMTLLEKASWILIPAQFESKKRSVFVIEKGPSGAAAMAKAFAAWKQAPGSGQGQ